MESKNLSRVTMLTIFMLLIVTCSMVESTLTLATVLPQLHRCNRHLPDIGKCVKRSIESMKPYIANGIWNLNTKVFDPYHMIHYEFTLGNDTKVIFKNTFIYGLSNYTIRKQILVSVDVQRIEFTAKFPLIRVFSFYEIQSANLTLPEIKDGYKMGGIYRNVKAKITIDGEFYLHDKTEEEYFRLNMVSIPKLSVENVTVFRDNLESLSSSTNATLTDIWQLISNEVLQIISLTAPDEIFNFASKIYDNFPTKMLFPL
ncbi:uncharacterized protein LOC116848907 [Odontomachus brunneus]|uniref:uncharacterized protein LOC116848907 n=1 Tax=Odontomachus brunneus TaxID=486640 RepID=UPI0013F1EB0E|nr:uncharacterized protein LOC116848907 [Odontomachus brunneus]